MNQNTIEANFICPSCGEKPNLVDQRWRLGFDAPEHHHGYPVGHVECVLAKDATPCQECSRFYGHILGCSQWAIPNSA